MTQEIISVDLSSSLQEPCFKFLRHNIGSVVVLDEGDTPRGILTESDIIRGVFDEEKPVNEIALKQYLSSPLVTIEKGRSIRMIAEKMRKNDIKHLPVVDNLTIVGIITMTDIVKNFNEIRKEHDEEIENQFKDLIE